MLPKFVFSAFLPMIFGILFLSCQSETGIQDLYPGPLRPLSGGEPVTLQSFVGKVLVLDFWATWCDPCAKSIPTMNAWKEQVDPSQFAFFAINTDTNGEISTIQKKAEEWDIRSTILLDTDWKLTEHYKVEGLPCLLVFNPKGKIVHRQLGVSEEELPGFVLRSKLWLKSY